MDKIRLRDKTHCFVLGKGYGEPVAMEGALKLKEMSYIHAEGYSGGALKHGPFALIDGEDVSWTDKRQIAFLTFVSSVSTDRLCF